MTPEAQIAQLNQIVRRQRVIEAIGVVLILTLAASWWWSKPKEIRASRFVLVDASGVEYGSWSVNGGRPRFELATKDGKSGAVIDVGATNTDPTRFAVFNQDVYLHADLIAKPGAATLQLGSINNTIELDGGGGSSPEMLMMLGGTARLRARADAAASYVEVIAPDGTKKYLKIP